MDDQKCIVAILKGDKQAFRVLLERYEHKVYGFVNKMLMDPQLSEDVTQETFLAVYRNLKQYDQTKPFSTWLFAIAKNATFKLLKERSKSGIHPDEAFEAISEPRALVEPQIFQGETNKELMDALESLSEHQNQVITLRYFEDLSLVAIAKRLGISQKKVENLLYTAKQRLKVKLKPIMKEDFRHVKAN